MGIGRVVLDAAKDLNTNMMRAQYWLPAYGAYRYYQDMRTADPVLVEAANDLIPLRMGVYFCAAMHSVLVPGCLVYRGIEFLIDKIS